MQYHDDFVPISVNDDIFKNRFKDKKFYTAYWEKCIERAKKKKGFFAKKLAR